MLVRRAFLRGGAAIALLPLTSVSYANRFVPGRDLRTGDFTWNPQRAANGPVLVVASSGAQQVHVYRGGVEIGVSACIAGRPGSPVPAGLMSVMERQRAPIAGAGAGGGRPLERISWSGALLQAQGLDRHPPGHAALRLPMQFAAVLADALPQGTPVAIASERTLPVEVSHSGLLMLAASDEELRQVSEAIRENGSQTEASSRQVAVVVSVGERRAFLFRNGAVETSAAVAIRNPSEPIGTHLYQLIAPAAASRKPSWLAFGLGERSNEPHIEQSMARAALERIELAQPGKALEIARALHVGATLFITDQAAPAGSRTRPQNLTILESDVPGADVTTGSLPGQAARPQNGATPPAQPASPALKAKAVERRPSVRPASAAAKPAAVDPQDVFRRLP